MDGIRDLAGLPHVLVVDDDRRIRELVSRYLEEHGFVVLTARDAAEARSALAYFAFDILVIDVMMPGETGLELTRALRGQDVYAGIPLLLLTALGEAGDRIEGFEAGADDYLPKPFEPQELVLRLKAILRRAALARQAEEAVLKSFKVGRWRFNPDHDELRDGEERVMLTTVEANLIKALAAKPGEVLSREELAAQCGMDDAGERTIDVQVTRLRRKIEEDTRAPLYLRTVRGKGYMLRVEAL